MSRLGRSGLAILALALVVRLALQVASPAYRPALGDPLDYDRHGVSIARGAYPDSLYSPGFPTAFRPPVYPALLGAVYAATGTAGGEARWGVARSLQAAIGAVLALLIGLLALRVHGDRRVGIAAGLLAAVHLPLAVWGTALLSEVPFILLEVAAILAVLRWRGDAEPRRTWLVLAGVLAGAAALTRPNGILLLIPLAFGAWTGRPRRTWRALASPALLVAVSVAIVVPWSIRNAVVLRAFVPVSTQLGVTFAGTYNEVALQDSGCSACWAFYDPRTFLAYWDPAVSETENDRRLLRDAVSFMGDHPGYVVSAIGWNTIRMFGLGGPAEERLAFQRDIGRGQWFHVADVTFFQYAAVGFLAVVGLVRGAARRIPRFVLLVPVLYLTTVLSLGSQRYRMPIEPFILLLAAPAAVWLWDGARDAISRPGRAGRAPGRREPG